EEAEALRFARIALPSEINPQVPPELDRIVMMALVTNPQRRYQMASELADALETFAAEAGLVIEDADVAAWLKSELGELPSLRTPTQHTEEIAIDIDAGVEQAFAQIRARTEPSF